MPNRPMTVCSYPGCSVLVRGGYCAAHTRTKREQRREAFVELDRRKTPEAKAFYASRRWTETSKRHREREPLCRRCKANGIVRGAEMVHHNPPVEVLLARGLSPYDDAYLESLCNACHMEELRAKRVK